MNHVVAAGLALVVGCGLASAQQDKIVSKDGKERTAKIQSEDYDGLKLSIEGGTTTVPWKDVDAVRYGGATKYHEALEVFDSEGPAKALPLLEALAADDKLRPVLRHGVLYHLGLAQRRAGNDDAAIASLEGLLSAFPKSRYLVAAGTNLLSLYVAKGNPAGASKVLDATLAAARSGGQATGQQAGFDFLRGRLLEEQKKYDEAERVFQGVATGAGNEPGLALSAKLAVARCAQRANRTNDAQQRYREIVALDAAVVAPNAVLAGAWNGLGDLALSTGSKDRNREELRYALFCYLRGVVLYVPERGETTEEYERSLAGSARAFKAVSEVETDAARKKMLQARALERRKQLADNFPRSRYLEEK